MSVNFADYSYMSKKYQESQKALEKAVKVRNDATLEASKHIENNIKLQKEIVTLTARIAELEAENERLSQLLHDEMSQLEIATDLGNKRWTALNEIYEDGEKHNTHWCKRIAQEGLGLK